MSDYKISKEGSTEVFPADSTEVHESSPGVSETINGTETMESTEVVSGSAISADIHAMVLCQDLVQVKMRNFSPF